MGERVTVRDLINMLLGENPDAEIIIKDKDGHQLHEVSINIREDSSIGALFG